MSTGAAAAWTVVTPSSRRAQTRRSATRFVHHPLVRRWSTDACSGVECPLDPLPPGRLLSPNGLLGASAEEIQVDHRKPLSIERLGADHADTATGRIQQHGHESRLESL